MNAIEDLKVDIEKAKLEAGEIVENVQKWGATIEQHTNEADLEIPDLTRSLEEAATRAEDYKREKEKTLLDQQQEEELEFEKLKLEQKAKIQQTEQAATKPASKSNLKMPKLIITPMRSGSRFGTSLKLKLIHLICQRSQNSLI